MRKFISAAIAFAMTATAMAGMTVARAADTVTTTYVAGEANITTFGTYVNKQLSVIADDLTISGENISAAKYYAAITCETAAEIAYDLGTVKAGDAVSSTMTYKLSDAGEMKQYLYIIPEDVELSTSYTGFTSTYAEYKVGEGNLYNAKNNTWTPETLTATAAIDGKVVACVVGKATTGKLTSHVLKFDVTVTSPESTDPDPEPTDKYFTVDGTVDKAGTYKQVKVTANNGVKDATATANITGVVNGLTLEAGASVSIGIKVTEIPDGTPFEITRITLE